MTAWHDAARRSAFPDRADRPWATTPSSWPIDTEGKKQVLGLREGTAENSQVVKALLRDLIDRGLDPARARLFVVDGAKALQTAIRKIFGPLGVMQRCQIHKRRNILGHLPEHQHARVRAALTDVVAGRRRARHPAAGAPSGLPGRCPSRRGGLRPRRARGDPDTPDSRHWRDPLPQAPEHERHRELEQPCRHLRAPCEALTNGAMVVRWVSTGIVEAEKTFRRVQGYRDIAQLVHVLALEVTEEEAPGERVA